MSDDFFDKNKREIEAYSKWLDETLTNESGKTDPVRDLILVSEGYYFKSKLIVKVLGELISNKYGALVPYAINNLGDNFVSIIKATREKDPDKIEFDIDTIMNFLGQVAQEVQLRKEGSPSIAISEVLNYLFYSEYRTDEEKVISVYLTGKLPFLIYQSVIDEQKGSVTNQINEVEAKVSEWNTKLNSLDDTATKVSGLQEQLKEQNISFNFLGLSAAFNQFYGTKRTSLFIALGSLIVLGILILVVPAVTLVSINTVPQEQIETQKVTASKDEKKESGPSDKKANQNKVQKSNDFLYVTVHALPIIAIEIILLYYFRILLQNYNSTKSQIMQLQMRNAICKFIEPYVQFKEEHKEFKDSFDKFESLIFSGLAPNDESIPSTFDGIEQLGKLVKTIKG
jgi:hypothetical protein